MTAASTTLEFRLPDLGEGVAETEIVRWLVEPGERVAEDQPMVEVMTDKATVEIPAPAAGVVDELGARAGTVVQVGAVILRMTTDEPVAGVGSARENTRAGGAGAAVAAAVRSPAGERTGRGANSESRPARVQATPLVRKLAAGLGVDLASVSGSGANGRITEEDVRAAASGDQADAAGGAHPSAGGDRSELSRASVARVVPLRGMRRQIAEHLRRAAAVPTVTVVEEVELTDAQARRAEEGPSLLGQVCEAVAAALAEVPELNAHVDESAGEILQYDHVHLGVAVQTDDGLVVPVLRDAHERSAEQIDEAVTTLAERARTGALSPSELRGSTFTVTSAGKLGGLFTTPLLNVPEVGILGIHRAEDRAVVRHGEVVVRRMANLSVTFDHRALDGVTASRFLLDVISRLERS